jgi:hypothetical protein
VAEEGLVHQHAGICATASFSILELGGRRRRVVVRMMRCASAYASRATGCGSFSICPA